MPFTTLRPQLYVPGPSKWFVAFRDPVSGVLGSWNLLGYTEQGSNISMMQYFGDVQAEYAGAMPADVQRLGEGAFASVAIVKYQEEVVQALLAQRSGAITNATYGIVSSPMVLGDLMIQDNRSIAVSIVSMYASKTGNRNRITAAHTFWWSWIHDNYDFTLNVRPKTPRMVFRAISNVDECAMQYSFWTPGLPQNLDPTVCI